MKKLTTLLAMFAMIFGMANVTFAGEGCCSKKKGCDKEAPAPKGDCDQQSAEGA